MFNWFRRRPEPPKPSPSAQSKGGRPAPLRPTGPAADAAPLPEVMPEVVAEGSTEADWSAWEDSMTAWNSQLGDLPPSDRVQVRETSPSQLDDQDPFAGVHRKRDI